MLYYSVTWCLRAHVLTIVYCIDRCCHNVISSLIRVRSNQGPIQTPLARDVMIASLSVSVWPPLAKVAVCLGKTDSSICKYTWIRSTLMVLSGGCYAGRLSANQAQNIPSILCPRISPCMTCRLTILSGIGMIQMDDTDG